MVIYVRINLCYVQIKKKKETTVHTHFKKNLQLKFEQLL